MACLLTTTFVSAEAQTAPVPLKVRLICYDILVFGAKAKFFGEIEDENHFSSQGRFAPANDELAFAPIDVPTTHFGTFQYTDGQFFETFPLPFELDIPDNDANQNGIYDLLEYDQGVATTTTIGTYTDTEGAIGGGEGSFTAKWTKPANSHGGTVVITFDFNNPVAFTHGFQILNYQGDWTAAVKENSTVHGPVTVVRDGVPEQTLGGELALSLAQQGEVKLTTTSLTNEFGATFEWAQPETMERDRTEYYEFLSVTDGWLYEPTFDFMDWLIIIDDKNDADHDGIPDLTDPPAVTAAAPTMQIIKTANGIRLMITGDIGATYTLEDAPSLPAAQWLHPTTVTLTASPQALDLPAPTTATFWRMRFP
jgi:hypothetical protein